MSLQQLLWDRWGRSDHPAEWDGRGGNGGKGSQRFWEYLWVIQQIGSPHSVLDAGCGETMFFPNLLRHVVSLVFAVDPLLPTALNRCFPVGIEQFVSEHPKQEYDWITCVSVLEHIVDKTAFCKALDSFNAPIAMTLELGDGCVTMAALYESLSMFNRHYLSKMEACPVVADNSYGGKWRPLGLVLEVKI